MGCANSSNNNIQQDSNLDDGDDDYWGDSGVRELSDTEIAERIEKGKGNMPMGNTGMKLRYAFQSQRGYYPDSPDKNNQDAFKVIEKLGGNPNIGYFGVYDGHGRDGDKISYYVRDTVERQLKQHVLGTPTTDATFDQKFSKVYTSINQETHRREVCGFDDQQSGTTAVAVYIEGFNLKVSNIGDSRCVIAEMVDGKLKAIPLTQDQTPYRKDERERCKKLGARIMNMDQLDGLAPMHENWGLSLGDSLDEEGDPPRIWHPTKKYPGCAFTRSIGDRIGERLGVFAEPEITSVSLNENSKFMVIASDGVWEFITSQGVIDMVAEYKDPLDACKRVVNESYHKWLEEEVRTDDITMIVVHFDNISSAIKKSASAPSGSSAASMSSDAARPVRRGMSKAKKKKVKLATQKMEEELKDYDISKFVSKKTSQEKKQIEKAIGSNYLFAHLNKKQKESIYSVMKKHVLKRGEVVIRQGDTSSDLYVVDSGVYEVLVHSGVKGEKAKAVFRYENSGLFGELSLMYGEPRKATVRCISSNSNILWSLDRASYKFVLGKSSSKDLASTLRHVTLFKELNGSQIDRLIEILTEQTYAQGENIVKQGDEGDTFYVIKSGTVDVFVNDIKVVEMSKGKSFGERALLKGEGRRNATVLAQDKVTCLQVSRQGFEEVLGDLQGLIDAQVQQQNLDAITPGMHGRLAGSSRGLPKIQDLTGFKEVDSWSLEENSVLGRFGVVFDKGSKEHYSMWNYSKKDAKRKNEVSHAITRSLETMRMLKEVSCALPELVMTVVNDRSVCFVSHTPVVTMLNMVSPNTNFEENTAKFYAACLSSALEALHSLNIVCRSLDSIGVDRTGYPQLTDLRLSKNLGTKNGRTETSCGVFAYWAPECVRLDSDHGVSADMWALGVVVYEMMCGSLPFGLDMAEDEKVTYQKILDHKKGSLNFPAELSVSSNCENFVNQLCDPNDERRMTASKSKNHKWLKSMDWTALHRRQVQSPHARACQQTFDGMK
jgi:serine/threonine protein phosphatase PrpC/CRP-like cAMP-binding protein